jgi:hypothetical protein
MLTDLEIGQFRAFGYVVLKDFWGQTRCGSCKRRSTV